MEINNKIINRKIFFLAVNTGYVENGLPDKRCIDFYTERSGDPIYCSIVGNVVISDGFGTNNVCSKISKDHNWKQLASAISNNGTKAGIQLSSTWKGYLGNIKFVASRIQDPISDYQNSISKINLKEINSILLNLKASMHLSIESGFQHIQIHAAHGYLFSLLIDPLFNKHSDFFLNELNLIVLSMKEYGIETSIRFSLLTGSQVLDKQRQPLVDKIMQMGFDFFDVSFGFYNINKNLIYPETESALKSRRSKTIELAKKYPDKNIIISGKMNRKECIGLPENIHLGICRDLIANPNVLVESEDGCKNYKNCHYYSQGKESLECTAFNSRRIE